MYSLLTHFEQASKHSDFTSMGFGWTLFKMVLALVLICFFAYVILTLLKRRLTILNRRAANFRILDQYALSPRINLWIVEVGKRIFLLGSNESPGGAVTSIAELSSENLISCEKSSPSFLETLLRKRSDPKSR